MGPVSDLDILEVDPRDLQRPTLAPRHDRRRADVVILVSHGELADRAIAHMAARFPGLVVLREAPESKWDIIRRRSRILGPANAWGQVAAGVLIRLLARMSMARVTELKRKDPVGSIRPDVRVIDVPSVNSRRCQRALQLIAPRVVAVYGTRIITSATLDAIDAPFINYHAGINPQYRGQHPAYWAQVARDQDHAGVTVHLIDKGVDSGDIIYQAPVQFSRGDNITTYQMVQLAPGMDLLEKAVRDALAGKLKAQRVEMSSRIWYPPTIWQYLWNGVTKGVW